MDKHLHLLWRKRVAPDMPDVLTSNWGQGEGKPLVAYYIRKYFKPMRVSELGICEDCQNIYEVSYVRKKDC